MKNNKLCNNKHIVSKPQNLLSKKVGGWQVCKQQILTSKKVLRKWHKIIKVENFI